MYHLSTINKQTISSYQLQQPVLTNMKTVYIKLQVSYVSMVSY